VCENSGRDKTTCFVYSVGWTRHSKGVQNIRASAIIQLLLGNMGRPGGGIMALRGHASIQGSTDIPTLFDILPGYIPMPHAAVDHDLNTLVERNAAPSGYWGNMRSYTLSLLKAWYGDAATGENDYCFGHLPRLTGDHSIYPTIMGMVDGWCRGFFVMGQSPAVGGAHGKLPRLALANLDWLVVRDLQEIETAAFWYDSPEIETGELETKRIGTEVFFMPAASHVEKSGTFTNTQRLLQWREQAVEPRADCRSELWFMYHLGRKVREKLASSTDPRDHPRPDLGLPHGGAVRRPLCRGGTARDQRLGRERRRPAQLHLAQARRLDRLRMLDLLRLLRQRDEPDRSPQAPGPSRLGSPPSGAGPGHSTAVSSTTVPPQTPKASRGPRGRNTSGEMRRTSGGPATTSPTSR
jgi:formate dehydrogenase major subunit